MLGSQHLRVGSSATLTMGRPRVILVEDDEATLEVFASALREEFAVFVARNGTSALEVAEELGWNADALVIDLALGEGPRGDQFVAYYRTRARYDPPVIVVSGAPRAYEVATALRPAAILAKPIDLDDLQSTLRLFARRRGEGRTDAAG